MIQIYYSHSESIEFFFLIRKNYVFHKNKHFRLESYKTLACRCSWDFEYNCIHKTRNINL
jgi:hypothetical protein